MKMKIKKKDIQPSPEMIEKLRNFKPQPDHALPVTRRDFLGLGLAQGTALIAFPSVLTAMAQEAHAQATGSVTNPPAYLEIHAVGGAANHAQVAMTDLNRAILGSYSDCGQGSRAVAEPNITTMFSNKALFFKNSGFFKGLNAIIGTDATLQAQTAFLSLATDTAPDTSGNPMSAMGLVQSVIAAGRFLPALQSHPVINQPAFVTPKAPMIVESFQDISNVVAPRANDILTGLSASRRVTMMKALKSLNDIQIKRFLGRPGGLELQENANGAHSKVATLLSSSSVNFDPRNDASVNAIWASTYKEQIDLTPFGGTYAYKGPENEVASTVIYNLAKGYATSAALHRGGYDYHGGLRFTSDAYDENLGKLIGRALLTFKAANKPAFIYVTSDGSCSSFTSEAGGNQWVGDRSFNSVNFIIAFRPGQGVRVSSIAGRSEQDFQIGHFTSRQVSDSLHPVASARGSAAAAFVNYLNFCGLDGVNAPVMAKTLLSTEQVKQLSKIA